MWKWHILAPLVAMTGAIFGIFTILAEGSEGIGILAPFLAAPVIEEAVKPIGVYLLLAKKPAVLRGRLYTACLSGLAGLSFGIVESLAFVFLYARFAEVENYDYFVAWRFSICLLLHSGCSFIAGFGINERLSASVKGEIPFLKSNWKFFLIPMAIHAAYNITVTVLSVLDLIPI